jgi:hypothetical protein
MKLLFQLAVEGVCDKNLSRRSSRGCSAGPRPLAVAHQNYIVQFYNALDVSKGLRLTTAYQFPSFSIQDAFINIVSNGFVKYTNAEG